jgi:hypothetical protein
LHNHTHNFAQAQGFRPGRLAGAVLFAGSGMEEAFLGKRRPDPAPPEKFQPSKHRQIN